MIYRRLSALALLLSLTACTAARHHWTRIEDRHHPREGVCDHPPILAEHPAQPFMRIAVVTAECGESKENECREHLQLGACEANVDALIDVANDTPHGVRRMVAVGIEYTPESSGGDAHSGSNP